MPRQRAINRGGIRLLKRVDVPVPRQGWFRDRSSAACARELRGDKTLILITEGSAMSHAKKSFIRTNPFVMLFLLLASPLVYAKDRGSYPDAPPKLKDAEAKGLHRLTNDELKTFFPGSLDVKRHKGGLVTKIFKPDGSVQAIGFQDLAGTWRFD
jgi:hypothetical protein